MHWVHQFSRQKTPWFLLAASALSLFLSALYFQHVMDLLPCIKCIYQRTAVLGILIGAILPLIYNTSATRFIAYAIWAYSAFEGLMSAQAHLDVIFAANPYLLVCDIVPNFPSFLPLHEWLPAVFAAPGDCADNSWQFLGLGMASWLEIIFSIYLVVLAVVLACKAFCHVKNKTSHTPV